MNQKIKTGTYWGEVWLSVIILFDSLVSVLILVGDSPVLPVREQVVHHLHKVEPIVLLLKAGGGGRLDKKFILKFTKILLKTKLQFGISKLSVEKFGYLNG